MESDFKIVYCGLARFIEFILNLKHPSKPQTSNPDGGDGDIWACPGNHVRKQLPFYFPPVPLGL